MSPTTLPVESGRSRRPLVRLAAIAVALGLSVASTAASEDTSGPAVSAPRVRAAAAIVYNTENGDVLWELNGRMERSIASITKVMTAIVALEEDRDPSEVVVVDRADVRRASTTYLRAGDEITRDDLLHLALVASDNAAARALARASERGPEVFVQRMNEKAEELGLTSTRYADPSGLDRANVSTAFDMAKLMTYASGDARLTVVMQKQEHVVAVGRRTIRARSTNQLVRSGDIEVLAGKTGFIRVAGYCLATLLRLPEGGPSVAVVVLGARSNASRFAETRQLFDWVAGAADELIGVPLTPPALTGAP